MMRLCINVTCCLCIVLTAVVVHPPQFAAPTTLVRVYLTTHDLSQRLSRQPDLTFLPGPPGPFATITVDETKRYQSIVGFGGAMTDSSAWLLATKLSPSARDTVLHRLFDPVRGIGLSFLRLPIGASDFIATAMPYSYDDMPAGQSDPGLAHFSIAHDLAYIIPMLRSALRINPALFIVASPWSPPGWMKTVATAGLSGAVQPTAYAGLAAYFVRFIRAYAAAGVPIAAITPQNEPGAGDGRPGVAFPAADETRLIAGYLGPALAAAHLHTGILAYDSYWDSRYTTPGYPFLVMASSAARRYIAGTAWHCYEGSPEVMSVMHQAYPDKDNYETECSSGIAHGDPAELIIASTRNWTRGVLLWNLALDTSGGPKQGNWCPHCTAPVTVDQATGAVSYSLDYYQLGQASRFIRRGAVRIASTTLLSQYKGSGLGCRNGTSYGSHIVDNAAFQNPDGSIAVLAYNGAPPAKTFTIAWHGRHFRYTLPPCGTVTFVWQS